MTSRGRAGVLVRCDANRAIGLGHVSRGLALAEEIAERLSARCVVLARPNPLISNFLHSRGVELHPVGAEGYAAEEVADVARRSAVLVTDSYELDNEAIGAVGDTGISHVVIDDFARLAHWPCSVVVNPNLGASPTPYRGAESVLVGSDYALLGREVRAAARAVLRPIATQGQRVLVCLGGGDWGADGRDLLRVLGELSQLGIEVRATRDPGDTPPGVTAVSSASLVEQLGWADAAVLSGGVVKYEAAACGLPSLLVAVVEHQTRVARSFADTGAAAYIGSLHTADSAEVSERVRLLLGDASTRSRMRQAARLLVDGAGVARVANVLYPQPGRMG